MHISYTLFHISSFTFFNLLNVVFLQHRFFRIFSIHCHTVNILFYLHLNNAKDTPEPRC